LQNPVTFQPSLSEALDWCRRAGVNRDWGRVEPDAAELAATLEEFHDASAAMGTVTKVVVHRSGFTCANAALLRWYHRVVNGWRDIGYHFVIGNGAQGDSVRGGIEAGRPVEFEGAHVRGKNAATLGVCLIDNEDHFRTKPPSAIEVHALENAAAFLLDRFGVDCEVLGHGDLAAKDCPGAAVAVESVVEVARRRARRSVVREAHSRTLDLRGGFRTGELAARRPAEGLARLGREGFNRIAYPYHWLGSEWEDLALARGWVDEARVRGIETWLYTGPFGAEPPAFLAGHPNAEDWLQRKEDGRPANYADSDLLLFCPLSAYVTDYRLDLVLDFVAATGCDGIFLDIPWLAKDACFCTRCRRVRAAGDRLTARERVVRDGLERFLQPLRSAYPELRVGANAAAPAIWDAGTVGATPRALSGLFDELVVEWTPSKDADIEGTKKSIRTVRAIAPCTRVSHAYDPGRAAGMLERVQETDRQLGVGAWLTGTRRSR
jgi:hypothetical protein